MTGEPQPTVSILSADDVVAHLPELGALLRACVHAGAAINFVLPYTEDDGRAFWTGKVLPGVRQGVRSVLVAWVGGRIAGSVQLDTDTPPNQPHRAEVSKLMVHPEFRRQGIARTLMVELERLAGRQGRSLITLDTRTGDHAEPLYASLGYRTVGVIPGYSLDPLDQDRLDATTIMYKAL
ncbi:MAG: GNAT family N-acetyltransferase [Hyphomicrobiales bacterium]|nr:GNAT family N-acetyltransferase [Hyphomicrobiales bacterium]